MKNDKRQRKHWGRIGYGVRGAGECWNEGIGCFAAKRGIGLDECALGMEAEMIFGAVM